jgi:zinc protease
MKNFFIIAFLSLSTACSTKISENSKNEARTAPETRRQGSEKNQMKRKTDYILKTLPNGLEVYMFPKKDIPMVTVLLAVKNGAYVQTPDIDGLAHLYEHMFFKANEKIPSQAQFMRSLDEMGVELGPNMNAYTSTESVRYFFTIQTRYLERGLSFMADAAISPKFLEDELEKERQVVIGEFDRYEASPIQVFYQKDILGRLFSTYFSRKNTIGSREVITAASQEQMKQIQNRFYIPNNSALFLVGDFDPQATFKLVEKDWGAWRKAADPFVENPIPEHPTLEKSDVFIKRAPVQTLSIVKAFQGPKLGLETREVIAMDLMSLMLGMESSEFQKQLVHSGLASSAYFYVWSQRYTSPLFLSLDTSPDKAQLAYDRFKDLLDQISRGNFFTEEQLELAKTSIEVRTAFDREVGQKYALALASVWTSTGNLDFYTNYISEMKAISLKDIDRAIDRYLNNKAFVLGALVPESGDFIQFDLINENLEL